MRWCRPNPRTGPRAAGCRCVDGSFQRPIAVLARKPAVGAISSSAIGNRLPPATAYTASTKGISWCRVVPRTPTSCGPFAFRGHALDVPLRIDLGEKGRERHRLGEGGEEAALLRHPDPDVRVSRRLSLRELEKAVERKRVAVNVRGVLRDDDLGVPAPVPVRVPDALDAACPPGVAHDRHLALALGVAHVVDGTLGARRGEDRVSECLRRLRRRGDAARTAAAATMALTAATRATEPAYSPVCAVSNSSSQRASSACSSSRRRLCAARTRRSSSRRRACRSSSATSASRAAISASIRSSSLGRRGFGARRVSASASRARSAAARAPASRAAARSSRRRSSSAQPPS